MQISNRISNSYPQSFRANSDAPKKEYETKNQIPKRVAISVGIFASSNVVQQLLVKNSKKMQSWVSPALSGEILQKGFSTSHLGKDVALGALLGVVLGYFENKDNEKRAQKAGKILKA